MTERHLAEDDLLDLALGSGDAANRERVTAHLADCPECHARYSELDEAMRAVVVAAPSVAPPAGFSGRVLTAASGDQRTRRRWSPLLVAAAAVIIGLAAGIGGTVALTRSEPAAIAPRTDATGVLATQDGETVGTAAVASIGGDPYLVISISAGRPGARYECLLVDDAGGRTSGGTWTLEEDRYGAGGASGVWLVPLGDEPPVGVELETDSGRVWASAEF